MTKRVIKASDIMQEKHLELDGLATVKEALEAMKRENADVVIVKKRDEHDAYGLVLLSDIAKNVLAKNRSPDRVNIYEIMSKPVISIEPELDVRYCARLFDNFGLSNAPVIHNNEVLGVVSYSELVLHGLYELME